MINNLRNPYIIGSVIDKPDQLFGRESLFQTIEELLLQDTKLILLHGQRRIGKSSVLKNIPLALSQQSQDQFTFVHCDLQTHAHSSLNEILCAIAAAIVEKLQLDTRRLNRLSQTTEERNLKNIFRGLLVEIYEELEDQKLVLLLDEFDVVSQNDNEQALQFLRFFENLVTIEDSLFVIAVVGRYLHYMPNLIQIFKDAPSQEIGLLTQEYAEKLISSPVSEILQYNQEAIAEILKLSSGHPYYIQVLCFELFNLARNGNRSRILRDDVHEVIAQALEDAEGGLDSFWIGLTIPEKIVSLAVAEAKKQQHLDNPLKLLEDYGLVITDDLEQAINHLISQKFLNNEPIKIKVELICLWLLKRHQLINEVRNLENLNTGNINNLLITAREFWLNNNTRPTAIDIYKRILDLNPNHFTTVLELAQKYLEIEKFEESLQLYERAYKLNNRSCHHEFVELLNKYGNWLITQKNYIGAREQYKKVLQIEPGNSTAQQKIQEINTLQARKNRTKGRLLLVLTSIMTTLITVPLITFAIRTINLNPKLPSTTSQSSISKGDRTLFPGSNNPARDRAINSFKQGNYSQAQTEFAAVLKQNRNDPEILIYENNALAIHKGNPLTLATVVPANSNRTDFAKEVLRGIAQAQNEFNQQGGLNGRFLEIIIADDGNDEDKAKKVVRELVQNPSILGVIGHNSSNITGAVLNMYEQNQLAVISATSSSTKLQSSVFFRTTPTDRATGKKLAEYLSQKGIKKSVIFCIPGDPYSESLREAFRVRFDDSGEILVDDSRCLELSDIDRVKSMLNREQKVAIMLFPSTKRLNDAIETTRTLKEWIQNMKAQQQPVPELMFLGGDSLYNLKIITDAGRVFDDLVLAVPWFNGTQKSQRFAEKARKQWGANVSWRTATSFDATLAFIESFKASSNPSKEEVLEKLPKVIISSDKTSGDELALEPNSQKPREATIVCIKNSNFNICE